MSLKRETRHFHAGKLRKVVGGVEFVEVAESKGKLFVSRTGHVVTPKVSVPAYAGVPREDGYLRVGVHCKTVSFDAYVHRVVYEVFKGVIPDGMEIDHVDGSRHNNRLENLQLVSHRDNIMSNPITRERHRAAASANAKTACELNKVPVVATDSLGKQTYFGSIKDAVEKTGVRSCLISGVIHGRRKTAGGFRWEVA